MWSIRPVVVEKDKTMLYRIFSQDKTLSFEEMIRLWQEDNAFCSFFKEALAKAPWPAFFWEMPALYRHALDRTAEFVLINSPQLVRVSSDTSAFQAYFEDQNSLTVNFTNLGGDARLLAPLPLGAVENYTHLARFVRHAPKEQQMTLFQQLGNMIHQSLGERPLWVSTSGLGVHWLHIRLDEKPKYYQHMPYRYA